MAAPIAAFTAITRRRADRACTVERSDSGRSTAEDGGRRLFCVAMQSALQGAVENSRRPPLQDANRLPSDRPLEGRARPFRHGSNHRVPMRSIPRARLAVTC